MQTMALSRRRFLLSSAVLGVVGLTAGAPKAFGFSVEEMDVKTAGLALGACQVPGAPNSYHLQLIADITAALQGKSRAEIDAQLAAAVCPLCGCRIE